MGLLLKLFLKSGECKTIFTDHCLMLVNVRGLLYLAKVIILLKKDIKQWSVNIVLHSPDFKNNFKSKPISINLNSTIL
jgi:hypothetical protein